MYKVFDVLMLPPPLLSPKLLAWLLLYSPIHAPTYAHVHAAQHTETWIRMCHTHVCKIDDVHDDDGDDDDDDDDFDNIARVQPLLIRVKLSWKFSREYLPNIHMDFPLACCFLRSLTTRWIHEAKYPSIRPEWNFWNAERGGEFKNHTSANVESYSASCCCCYCYRSIVCVDVCVDENVKDTASCHRNRTTDTWADGKLRMREFY